MRSKCPKEVIAHEFCLLDNHVYCYFLCNINYFSVTILILQSQINMKNKLSLTCLHYLETSRM